MARVFVVRHAEAAPGDPDELRPLTAAGRAEARALGKRLSEVGLDAVLTSPLLRARETATLVAHAAGLAAEVDERLAPGADAGAVVAAVAGRGEAVAVVGHQPDCSQVVAALGGDPDPSFPPAGFHVVDVAT